LSSSKSDGRKAAERFVARYNATRSLRPAEYADVTRKASYYVGLLLRDPQLLEYCDGIPVDPIVAEVAHTAVNNHRHGVGASRGLGHLEGQVLRDLPSVS
jgi:hypothetical protein